MQSTLLYFLLGLSIYLISLTTKKSRRIFKLLAYLETGFLGGLILGFITDFPLIPYIRLPWLALAVLGMLAGLILYIAEITDFFNTSGLHYFATLILGLIHAVLSYVFMKLYVILSFSGLQDTRPIFLPPLIFLLLSFIIFFGYTFPRRWIEREKARKEKNTQSPKN